MFQWLRIWQVAGGVISVKAATDINDQFKISLLTGINTLALNNQP